MNTKKEKVYVQMEIPFVQTEPPFEYDGSFYWKNNGKPIPLEPNERLLYTVIRELRTERDSLARENEVLKNTNDIATSLIVKYVERFDLVRCIAEGDFTPVVDFMKKIGR